MQDALMQSLTGNAKEAMVVSSAAMKLVWHVYQVELGRLLESHELAAGEERLGDGVGPAWSALQHSEREAFCKLGLRFI